MMIEAGRITDVIQRRLLAAAFIMLAGLTCHVSTASAASSAEQVGLAHRYTYSDSNCTKPVDPINVVWEEEANATPGNKITPDTVASAIAANDWPRDDYKSVVFKAARAVHAGDIGYQWIVRLSDGKCVRDARQMTDGSPAGSRFHVRLFGTSYGGRNFVVGDAHRDQKHRGDGCDTVPVPPGAPIWTYGHVATSFDEARVKMQGDWPGSRALKYWGNTQAMKQCNGQLTHSDGDVLYLGQFGIVKRAGVTYTNLSEPTISGTSISGAPLTVNPGSWSPTPSSFSYQWCRVNLETDSCAPIAGATGATWTPSNGDIGQEIAVSVAVASGETELSEAVEIQPNTPATNTTDAEEIGINSALLVGWLNPNGSSTNFYFEIGKTTSYGTAYPAAPGWSAGAGTSAFHAAAKISGLEAGTLYHYRIVAWNAYGTSYGPDRVFATKGPPQVITEPAQNVTREGARLVARINPSGLDTNYYFQYGKTTAYEYSEPWWGAPGYSLGSAGVDNVVAWNDVHVELGTTYHYRIVASNAAGTTYGEDRTFKTLDYPPMAGTRPATQVKETWATLNGELVVKSEPVHYYFQFGTTTSYGTNYPALPGETAPARFEGPVQRELYDLQPGTTYHYRLVAVANSGTDYGQDQTFKTTTPYTPSVEATPPGEVTQSKITMAGKADVKGLGGYYYFEYGNTEEYGSQTEEKFVPVGSGLQPVSEVLEGLPVGWAIHYRLVVTNEDRTIKGPDQVATTAWSNEPSTGPKSSNADWLNDVSCASAGNCIAVGAYTNSSAKVVGAERWNGTSWSAVEPPVPAGLNSELTGVSCPTATNCTAVGWVVASLSSVRPLIMKWNGSTWSETTVGGLPSTTNYLEGVSCPTTSSCEAVGYTVSGSSAKSLALHWNGTAWSVRPSANPTWPEAGPDQGVILQDVSCASPSFCKAVGYIAAGWPVIEGLSGSEWVSEKAVVPFESPGEMGVGLRGIACPTTKACIAVGWAGEGGEQPFVQRWDGYDWDHEWATFPSETHGAMALEDISCTSASACRAVGVEGHGARWTGSEWKLQAANLPAGADLSYPSTLKGISCPTGAECHAVGSYQDKSLGKVRLTPAWSGSGAVPQTMADTATSLLETGAVIRAFVDPAGIDTKYYFEYGQTSAYGSKTAEVDAGSGGLGYKGGAWVGAKAGLSGLSSGLTYHYRVVAVNGAGTAYGPDTTFRTINPMNEMPVTEAFNGGYSAISNFTLKWAPLQWTGSTRKGKNNTDGYGPVDTAVNGAYFMAPVSTEVGSPLAAEGTIATGPGIGGRVSLWLDMGSPATAKSGYELRFQETSKDLYTVSLKKWLNGVESALASKTGYSLPAGSSIGLVDRAGTVEAWGSVGGNFTKIISAADSAFSGGNAGVEVAGSTATRVSDFKFGTLMAKMASFDVASKFMLPADALTRDENPLSASGSWGALAWDTATPKTGRALSACGWVPAESGSLVGGAYWQKAMASDTGTGDAVIATSTRAVGITSYYFGLWLNAPNPGSVKSGYQLRVAETAPNTLEAKLIKWVSGSPTTLATKTGLTISGGVAGTKLALVDKGGIVSLWTSPPGGTFTQTLSAADSTYSYGYAGIEASGSFCLRDFKVGQVPPF